MSQRKKNPATRKRAPALTRTEKNEAAWARWEAAGRDFRGLVPQLEAATLLRHIFQTKAGYQVRIFRNGRTWLNRTVNGKSEASLLEAIRIRDEAERDAPPRPSRIPAWVLETLKLPYSVPGISRCVSRSCYRVHYQEESGRRRVGVFYYRQVSEPDAYAAAIAFLQSLPRREHAARRPRR